MKPENKFITKDIPLTALQVEEIGRIRVRDVRYAIAEADKTLRLLLEAELEPLRPIS